MLGRSCHARQSPGFRRPCGTIGCTWIGFRGERRFRFRRRQAQRSIPIVPHFEALHDELDSERHDPRLQGDDRRRARAPRDGSGRSTSTCLPPCNHACPAGENIQAWLDLAQAGRYEAAWQKYMEDNPLPGTHGRACYHPCESALQPRTARSAGFDPFGRPLSRRPRVGKGLDGCRSGRRPASASSSSAPVRAACRAPIT